MPQLMNGYNQQKTQQRFDVPRHKTKPHDNPKKRMDMNFKKEDEPFIHQM